MQLLLILGIVFAILAVLFAVQNNVPVTVHLAVWSLESTLAVVLLAALGLGVLIAALLSTPRVLRQQWSGARSRRQINLLEERNAALEARVTELTQALEGSAPQALPPAVEPKPYVGLKTLITGGAAGADGKS
ncbi:hypothetical protein BURK2_03575 [Burkholderiales bacterium]|jgi:uncharacterized integral membrane protein|nr:hypothetical protein BURK2_03575 [Burkholderiales bacterium]